MVRFFSRKREKTNIDPRPLRVGGRKPYHHTGASNFPAASLIALLDSEEHVSNGDPMTSPSDQAWNNFVLNSEPTAYAKGSIRWAVATANRSCHTMGSG